MFTLLFYLIGAATFFYFIIVHLTAPDPKKATTVGKVVILSIFWPLSFSIFLWLFFNQVVSKSQRFTAFRLALYYAFVPWYKYEKVKHYKGSYFIHAISNIGYALKWIFFLESKADREFEKTVNNNY